MQEAVGRQIGLVIRVECINEPGRHHLGEDGKTLCHRHDQCEPEERAPYHEQSARPDKRPGLD